MPAEAGRSLVELLVALGIALVLLSTALLCVLGAGRHARNQDASARLADDGQLALALLSSQLRMAGFSLPRVQGPRGVAASHYTGVGVRGCDHGFVSLTAATAEDLTCATTVGASAAFSVAHEADLASTWPGSSGLPTDCIGSQIAPRPSELGGTYTLAESRFFVRTNPQTGNPTLYCAGSGGTGFASQPLIDNLESLSVRWGVAEGGVDPSGLLEGDTGTLRYLSSEELDAALAHDPRRWTRVVSAWLCVVLTTPPGAADLPSAHAGCDGALVWPADASQRRIRRSFSLTVQLRNRGPGA
ncbi:MAG: hypothetical protein EOP93_15715 [Lysobacteraceae bacterium]|nr:MAG: hypothetical protein EOP93_15715 [Xanthomonadaceae bacterium]